MFNEYGHSKLFIQYFDYQVVTRSRDGACKTKKSLGRSGSKVRYISFLDHWTNISWYLKQHAIIAKPFQLFGYHYQQIWEKMYKPKYVYLPLIECYWLNVTLLLDLNNLNLVSFHNKLDREEGFILLPVYYHLQVKMS